MKERKVPMRTCLGCGNVFPKKALVRIVRTPEGQLLLDATGKLAGRGAYICRSVECLDKAVKAKRIGRALEAEVAPELIGTLKASLEVGSDAAEFALLKGKAKLIILSGDAGRSTIGKFASICEAKSVPLVRASTKEKLGKILGRSQVAVAAVTEVHFAKKMLD